MKQPTETPTSTTAEHSKRIASNSLSLSVRLALVMLISFYTSRVTLEALGEVDFGLFTLISAISTSFIFFSSALGNATQRYLAYELGQESKQGARDVFAISLGFYTVLGLAVFVLGEAGGLYLLYNVLDVPPDRFEAALWVVHCTVISVSIQFASTLYESVLMAHEHMKAYAWIGIVEASLRLVAVWLLLILPTDRLATYGVLLTIGLSAVRIIPAILCHRWYDECRLSIRWRGNQVREIFAFMGWNAVGSAVYTACQYGSDLLLNVFFGPALNAARGIAYQVNTVSNFTTNVFSAVRPQMIKSYASGHIDYLKQLLYSSTRLGFFLTWAMVLPLALRIDYILEWWLTTPPPYTSGITIWMLVFSLINVPSLPVWFALQSVGSVKYPTILGGVISIMSLPISYIVLRFEANPLIPFIVLSAVRVVHVGAMWYALWRCIDLSLYDYTRRVLLPMGLVVVSSALVVLGVDTLIPQTFVGLIGMGVFSLGIVCSAIWVLGLEASERSFVRHELAKRLPLGSLRR